MGEVRDTEIAGIYPGDFVLRTAIKQFLADMRSRPEELDFLWSWFAQDSLTSSDDAYGETQIAQAKEWFLKTNIDVHHNVRIPDGMRDQAFITLAIGKDDESFNTLGDSHWDRAEAAAHRPFYTSPFAPLGFSTTTGVLRLPQSVVDQVPMVPGVAVVSRDGRTFPIVEVLDDDSVRIENNGRVVDLKEARLRAPEVSYSRELGGAVFRQSYTIGVHSYSEPIHGLYLYAIVAYGLLKYRQKYLEARGLQGSQINIGPFDVDAGLGEGLGFSRIFQVQGLVHAVWAQDPTPNVLAVNSRLRVQGAGNIPVDVDLNSINDLLWIGEQDGLGTSFGSVVQLGGATVAEPLRLFFGVGPITLSTASEVQGLTARAASQRQTTFGVTAAPSHHIFFACPVSFGDPVFQVGAFVGGFTLAASLEINGVEYRLYRSIHAGLGMTTVVVL